jgi:glycosyltransferase involved in cell wall biosynthesis
VVNATARGSADKVVFEAMASGRPVLYSSPAFEPVTAGSPLPLQFPEGDAAALAERISTLAAASAESLADLGAWLRERIERDHSLEHWAHSVVAYAEELLGTR